MHDAHLILNLDSNPSLPVYLRICQAVASAIETGAFKPGDPLPGSRVLAEHFKVNRNTILKSLDLLEAEGWLETQAKRGTFVAFRTKAKARAGWEQPLGSLPSEQTPTPFQWTQGSGDSALPPEVSGLDLREGIPDARLFPAAELGRNYRKAMERKQNEALMSHDPKGHPDLRQALASWLARRRGLPLGPECLVTTTGMQMSIELLVKAALRNAGVVAIGIPGSPEIRRILEDQRVAILGIAVDEAGLDVAELAEHLEAGVPIRLLLVSAACHHPTGVRLSSERRQALLGLAARYNLVIAEDEGAAVWFREEPPPLPLAHFDRTGKVVHFGSFSQWLAPGVHSGFIYARGSAADRLASLKKQGHLNTDQVLESALATFLNSNALQNHLRSARQKYLTRLQQAEAALASWPGFQNEATVGGFGLWVRVPNHLDARAWQQACAGQRVSFRLGAEFGEPAGTTRHVYFGVAALDAGEWETALGILSACQPRLR